MHGIRVTKSILPMLIGLVSIVYLIGLASCASAGSGNAPASSSARDPDVYAGAGQSDSLLKAINLAKMDAVRKLIVDTIGGAGEQANQAKLKETIYNSNNPNQFIFNDTMVISRKDSVGSMDNPRYEIELTVKVRRQLIEQSLRSLGIGAQPGDGKITIAAGNGAKPNGTAQAANTQAPDNDTSTPEQRAFIKKYLDKLSYLVYFSDKTTEKDQFLLKAAVGQANSYLTTNGYTAVDATQVEKLKKDKSLVYEEQTGGQMSMIQWIAQSLNADVYLEIDASTTSEAKGGNYYGQAIIAVKMYETSTGQLLGSQPYSSPRTMSKVDQTDAVSNALQSSVYAVMPKVIEQSKTLLAKQFANGIHYELTIQKASDARVISNFRGKLKRAQNIAEVSTRSQSADALVLDVYYYGKSDDLSDLILGIAQTVSGLENMDLVLSRGKSLTFTSGM